MKFVVLLEQILKFLLNSLPSLLTSPRDGQSQLRIQKLIRSLLLWGGGGGGGGGGDHLNSAIHQGDQKNFTHTVGGITKNLQNLKNFHRPPSQ